MTNFIAAGGYVEIKIKVRNCCSDLWPTYPGIQAFLAGNCDNTEIIDCNANCSDLSLRNEFILKGNLIEGKQYFIIFDGCEHTYCDFQIEVKGNSGMPNLNKYLINEESDRIIECCEGVLKKFSLNFKNDNYQYEWDLDGTIIGQSDSLEFTPELGTYKLKCLIFDKVNYCFLGELNCTLIVNNNIQKLINAKICENEKYDFRGKQYSKGIFNILSTDTTNCDTLFLLEIEELPPSKVYLDTSICEGSSIVIAGKTYQSSMRDTLKLSSSLGCDSTIYLNIRSEALPVADAGLDQFIPCDLAFVTLKAASAGQGLSYQWKDSTGVIISTQDSVRIGNAGLYILELQNKLGCSDLDSIYVSASDKPVIDKVSTIPPFCTGESSGSISINLVTKGLTPYRYSLYQNNQAIITLPLGTVFNDLASGSYEVEVRDANNCLSRQTVILPDPDPATLQVYLDTSGLQNQKAGIPLLLKSSLFNKVQGRVSYTWTIDGIDICITNCSSQLSHSFDKSAWVRVCAEDKQCSSCDSSYILIQEEKKTDDPDIITDESDGFKFKDLEDPTITGTELWIATRHGTIVYNQKNYQCCGNTDLWKGQNQEGSILPTASYYYVFKIHYGANKKDEIRKGTITWIR